MKQPKPAEKRIKVQFFWTRPNNRGVSAKLTAATLNISGTKFWRGWTRPTVGAGEAKYLETIQIEVKSLRFGNGLGLLTLHAQVLDLLDGHEVGLQINGRSLLAYAIWADDQIKRLRKQVAQWEHLEALRKVTAEARKRYKKTRR